ncbi:MAG: hypothetical protein ACRD5L_08130, partial [Bryobacteraceae bacterium]
MPEHRGIGWTTLNLFRAGMRRVDQAAARMMGYPDDPAARAAPEQAAKFEAFFRALPVSANASEYIGVHLPRLVRTMTLVPTPAGAKRVLELGAYMQMTPALKAISGYGEVCAADFGTLGQSVRKTVPLTDGEFSVDVDLFNAERDRFPYPDGYFSLILC